MENSPSNSNLSEGNHSYRAEFHNQASDNGDDMGLLRAKYKHSTNKVYHDFYKTKMCSLYNLNICKKGKDCPFAHSEDELRDKPNLQKTKLCDDFLQGECHRGENCPFAHGEDELRSTPDLFKTAICNLWTQGKCTAGESCRFAHGYEDLRPAPSHHKFKKKPQVKKPHTKNNHNYGQNAYYTGNNQYAGYGSQMYGYPMYSMQMMPEDMQAAYLMNQPFAYNGGLNPQIKKY